MLFRFYGRSCLAALFCGLSMAFAQTETDELVERLGELMAENLSEDFDFSELAERLAFYRDHPVDLNKTTGGELRDLVFVPEPFIENLLKHRAQSGDFVSVYELQAIPGMDQELLRLLLPFVTVGVPPSLQGLRPRHLLREGRHDVMIRYGRTLQQRQGYRIKDTTRSRYLGTPDQLFVRYRYNFGNDLQVAVNMKKDAGEAFFSGAQPYGFDFYSGSIYLRNQGKLKNLVIGDYALQFGQGLAVWSGLGFGKGTMVHHIAKHATGLRPYTSSNEVLFLRGASATLGLGPFSWTPFASLRRLDGTVSEADDGTAQAGSLGQTGLHRTPTEVANRGALRQWVYGMNLQYDQKGLRLGAAALRTQFDVAISPPDLPRNRYAFRGDALWNASLYYHYSWRGVYVFGEAAHRLGAGFAILNGLVAGLSPKLSLALLHRHYGPDYHSYFNQGFAEGSQAVNERGFYSGIVYHPSRRVEWVLYTDIFHFPWLRYRVNAPSQGIDLLSQFTYTWYKKASLSIRYRYRLKQENAAVEDVPFVPIVDVVRQQFRIGGEYKFGDRWTMRNRAEVSFYQKEGVPAEWGWMTYQDVIYKPMASRLSGNIRVAVFGTPGYNSRIYAYENNVLYAGSFPMYHNHGIRTYVNLRRRFGRRMDVWARYATFLYRGVDEVGSGLDAIAGNQRSDVRIQIRWQF